MILSATSGELAAAEAVATVGHEGQTDVEASRRLRRFETGTVDAHAGTGRVVFAALLAAWWVAWRNGKPVASVAPLTLVVASAVVAVEVTVLATSRGLTHG
jgi:hypothetical protein